MASDDETPKEDEIPGDYDSVVGIKTRARSLGNPIIPLFIERAEDRIIERDDGYSIESPDVDANDAEMLFHFGLLTGAALEREYPAPVSIGEADASQPEVTDS